MDPVVTPATFSAAAKVIAQQGVQLGKARMRAKPSIEERKKAYLRFQDGALEVMAVMRMAAAMTDDGKPTASAVDTMLFKLTDVLTRTTQGLRELYFVAPAEIAHAAEAVLERLSKYNPELGTTAGIEPVDAAMNAALIEFTTVVRVDLRVDLPYRKHRWQLWLPAVPVRKDP